MDADVIALVEQRLADNAVERDRLTTEAAHLREAATRLRTGEALGVVLARLRSRGIEPADWRLPAGQMRRS